MESRSAWKRGAGQPLVGLVGSNCCHSALWGVVPCASQVHESLAAVCGESERLVVHFCWPEGVHWLRLWWRRWCYCFCARDGKLRLEGRYLRMGAGEVGVIWVLCWWKWLFKPCMWCGWLCCFTCVSTGLDLCMGADDHYQLCFIENWYSYLAPAKLKMQVFPEQSFEFCVLWGLQKTSKLQGPRSLTLYLFLFFSHFLWLTPI